MSEPPPLRGTSFQRKEGDTRIPHPRIVISSENETSFSFAIGEEMGGQRITGDTALSATWEHGASCRQLYEGKRKGETKRGNEKDPSAALGMTKRGNVSSHFFSFPLRKPTSAPKGRIRRKCSAVLCKSIYESSIIKQVIWTG